MIQGVTSLERPIPKANFTRRRLFLRMRSDTSDTLVTCPYDDGGLLFRLRLMGFAAKPFKISLATCFGVYVLAGLALLRDAQYVIIDGTLLLDLDDDGNSSKFGDLQAVSMVLAVAFLISDYAAGRHHKLRTESVTMTESSAPIKAGITTNFKVVFNTGHRPDGQKGHHMGDARFSRGVRR